MMDDRATLPQAWRALAFATLAFAANFSVWVLYAVLAIDLQVEHQWSATQIGILLAAPIFTGSVLRVPVGIWVEYRSARSLWIWQMLITAPALFVMPWVDTYLGYVALGLWLGLCGISFTLGIKYVTDWFSSSRQGLALGVFGAGNAGAAMTFMTFPFLQSWLSWQHTLYVYGAGLFFMLAIFSAWAPQLPSYAIHKNTAKVPACSYQWHLEPFKHLKVWRFGLYYYFVFGSFLALTLWLPSYYINTFDQTVEQAMAFTLLFVVTSSMIRALGGYLADRYSGRAVNWGVFWVCLVCLFFLCYPPTTMIIHGIEKDVHFNIDMPIWLFTVLICIIGLAQGLGRASVFKVLHNHYPDRMGSVGGIVGAIGGIGGFTLPVAFGLVQDLLGIRTGAFMVLYAVLVFCMMAMFFANRAERYQERLTQALADDFYQDN